MGAMFRLFSRNVSETGNANFRVPSALEAPQGFAPLRLRPMTSADWDEWSTARRRNEQWLRPWDSGDPLHGSPITFDEWISRQREAERMGRGIILLMELNGRIVGQISLGAVSYGAMRTGTVGYWVDEAHAGRGLAPLALAMLGDWALSDPTGPELHRMEVAILPENTRSKHVVEKVGMNFEGVRHSYMYVDGQWRDHDVYVLLDSDVSGSLTARLKPVSAPTHRP